MLSTDIVHFRIMKFLESEYKINSDLDQFFNLDQTPHVLGNNEKTLIGTFN